MNDNWKQRWNERYRGEEFAYGQEPNLFLEEQLKKLQPASILFPAEGEGRNAVFAARLGWKTFAFDISDQGRIKAMKLATKHNVSIDYQVGNLQSLDYRPGQFDAIALIYAHFPAAIKSLYHKILSTLLKEGGTIIFEAFSKKHLAFVTANENIGGPRDIDSLFSLDEIQGDFAGFEIIELSEQEIELHEGLYHNGRGSVIRFVGRKKTMAYGE